MANFTVILPHYQKTAPWSSRQIAAKGVVTPAKECVKNAKPRHSGAARRAEPGTQEHLNLQYLRRPMFMGSGLAGSARAPE
jgi:hypothetical protein